MLESALKHLKKVALKSSRAYREGRYNLNAQAQEALETLGLPYDSSFDAVKKRYRELCKVMHPDICKEESSEHFLHITAAYDVLKSAYKKKEEHE